MATIKKIAELLNISNATVSRVLNYDPKISVSEQTRVAIFKTAEQLGYKKKIVNPKIDNIALLYWVNKGEELDNVFNESIVNELLTQANERNMNIVKYEKVNGIYAISHDTTAFIGIGWFNTEEIEVLKGITTNGVFINSRPDESTFDSVQANQESMVRQIVDFFVKKGHTKIGFIGAPDYDMTTHEPVMDVREWSFRQTMTYYKLLNEDYVYIANDFTVKEGNRISIEALEKLQDDMPTAFCVANDTLAIGALQIFNEQNWDIPNRVSFFSINDIGIAQYVSPPLTTFHIDIGIICSSALDLIVERVVKNRVTTKSVYINGTPIYRKSC